MSLRCYVEPTHSSVPSAKNLALPHRQPRLDGVHQLRAGGKCRLAMVGGDRGDQRRLADLQDTDPVAGRNGPRPGGLRGDVGHHFGDDVGGRRVRGILKLHHLAPVVVVANHPDEPHDGSRRLMAHQLLVFSKRNRLIRQRGTHYQRPIDNQLYLLTPCGRSRSINTLSPG